MPAAVALPPLRRRCRVVTVFVLVAATLVVVVATAVAAVAVTSRTPWLKSTPVVADGARMGGSKINWLHLWLRLRLQYAQNCRYDDVGQCGPTNNRGTPGKRRSPPWRSIFRPAREGTSILLI